MSRLAIIVMVATLIVACDDETTSKLSTATPAPAAQAAAATIVATARRTDTATATPRPTSTPTPTPTPPPAPKKIGEPSTLVAGDIRLSIVVNAVTDPARSANQFNAPTGRWVLVDWTITNDGTKDYDVNRLDFKLQTVDGFLHDRGNHAGHREPQLQTGILGPGQTIRGFLVYDVAADQKVKALIYQPTGSRQFAIADLTAGQ